MIENPNVICNDCGFCKQNTQLKKLLKECKEMSFGIRLALSSGKINDVFTLTYKIENKINQALGEDE